MSSKGIEFDLNSQITDRWFINANYSYTDAQIEKTKTWQKALVCNVPKHQGAVSTNYEFLQEGARKAGVGANLTYVGERSGHRQWL